MALKKVIVTHTNQHGDVITRHFSIRAVVFDYANAQLQVMFHGWPSEEARQKGVQATHGQQNIPIDLSGEDGGLISQMSDVIWAKIEAAPFLTDFSDLENGKVVGKDKTLRELNAEIVEVAELKK